MTSMATFLDCFCGMGGASNGFHKAGFDCTGIDIVDVGYPYKLILEDMQNLDGKDFQGYDVIWGSPPCRDFTQLPDHWCHRNGSRGVWKTRKDVERGLSLVFTFIEFVEKAKPTFWILENVHGLQQYLKLKPKIVNAKILRGKRHVFYGDFPPFLLPHGFKKKRNQEYRGKLKSWERAKIPLPCSYAFAKACKENLLK